MKLHKINKILLKRQKDYKNTHKKKIISTGDIYNLKRILSFMKPYYLKFFIAVIISGLSVLSFSFEPLLMGNLVDEFSSPKPRIEYILFITFLFLLLFIGSLVIGYFSNMEIQRTGQKVIKDIRNESFKKIESLSISQINAMPVGKYVTRVTSDTDGVMELFTNVLVNLIHNIITLLSVSIIVLIKSWILGLIIMAFIPLVAVAAFIFKKYSKTAYLNIRNNISNMNAFLSENISGMKTTQIFNQEERKAKEFDEINGHLEHSYYQSMFVYAIFRPLMYLFFISATMTIFGVGIQLFWNDIISIGTLIGFVSYIGMFFNPIQQLAEQFNSIQGSLASASKVVSILDMKIAVSDKINPIKKERFVGKIEFRHVWFAYLPGEWILKDVSFTINPSETAAFVGATGAGKSTIIGLIVRNYEVQKGEVLIDDINVNDIELNSLRKNIGEMLQDVFLFSGSIASNIKLRDDTISDQEMIDACKYVGADKFIEKFEHKYEEEVRERGNNFSMGQRQLISFARTVAYKPSIMVLDEATANIDTETELLIQDSLKKMANIGTMVIVAHRLSTIQHANKIFVLQKGVIVESGNHQELLKLRGHYYNLYKLQYEMRKIESKEKVL